MKTTLTFFLFFLLTCSLSAQTPADDSSTYQTVDNILLNKKNYTLQVKYTKGDFTLKIINLSSPPIESKPIVRAIERDILYRIVVNLVKTLDTNLTDEKTQISPDEEKYLLKLKDKIIAHIQDDENAKKSEQEQLTSAIDNANVQYSAELNLNNSTKVPYKVITYKLTKAKKEAIKNQMMVAFNKSLNPADAAIFNNTILTKGFMHLSDLAEKDYNSFSSDTEVKKYSDIKKLYGLVLLEQEQRVINQYKSKDYDKIVANGIGDLEIKNALVQFFNNKASSIYIEAEISDDGVTETLIFVNAEFSVPLRYFNNYDSSVTALSSVVSNNGYRKEIRVDYNDLFDYKSDQFFNYSVANSQVHLSNEEGIKNKTKAQVVQRRFFDFFTGVIYSDVMGFNTENSNSLLNAQAKLLLPLNLRNLRKWSFGRQFITTANIALDNSFQNENRFINIKDDDSFSNFDLLKKNNLYGKLALDVISHEAKGWFTYISLGYNAAFYRTGLRFTETQPNVVDTVTERQLLSIGHGPFLNFEIRPQSNFGADVTFSLEDLNYSDIASISSRNFKDDIIEDVGKDRFVIPYNLINIEANFYWLVNPEKSMGGIYAKLGSYFNTDTNSVFPQLMVGYATNLTSFVNRFKPDDAVKDEKPSE